MKIGMAFLILLLNRELIFISATAFVVDDIETSETISNLTITSHNPSSHIFVLYFAEELLRGNYTLKMEFDRNADDGTKNFFQMFYLNEIREKKWMVATRFRGIGARQVFPCWDEPEFTATFRIAIKHRSNYTVLSNTPISEVHPIATAVVWRIFDVTPAIPTYLIAFTVFDPIPVYFFSDNILEADIIYEEGKDPVMRKIEAARLIACEMMQQLFSNLVSPSWWSYFWLNDGIAILFGIEVLYEILPDSRIMDLFAVQNRYESLHLDSGFMKPLTSKVDSPSEIKSLFSHPRYIKAFAVLRMLQHILSDDVFRQGISSYFST
ncbi:aminopeptidase N-like [Polyergus mexicanus]|uniref:aminopeptidase N-like n=1 Tax=Polyergus mexicanus TaxID=615972 RepID=UPI0038B67B66